LPFKQPNYRQERAQRDHNKRLKQQERLRRREEASAARKALQQQREAARIADQAEPEE